MESVIKKNKLSETQTTLTELGTKFPLPCSSAESLNKHFKTDWRITLFMHTGCYGLRIQIHETAGERGLLFFVCFFFCAPPTHPVSFCSFWMEKGVRGRNDIGCVDTETKEIATKREQGCVVEDRHCPTGRACGGDWDYKWLKPWNSIHAIGS